MKNKRVLHMVVMLMICMCGLFIMSGCGGCSKCAGKMTSCGTKACISGCITCANCEGEFCTGCINSCSEDMEEN